MSAEKKQDGRQNEQQPDKESAAPVAAGNSESAATEENGPQPAGAWQGKFKQTSSLFWILGSLLFILSVGQLAVLWLAAGSGQLRLIGDNSALRGQVWAAGLSRTMDELHPSAPVNKSGLKKKAFKFKPDQKSLKKLFRKLQKSGRFDPPVEFIELYKASERIAAWPADSPVEADTLRLVAAGSRLESSAGLAVVFPSTSDGHMQAFVPWFEDGYILQARFKVTGLEEEHSRFVRLGGILVAALLAGQLAVGGAIMWLVIKPGRRLSEASHQIADGKLDFRLPEKDRGNEMNWLTWSFNRMAAQLEEQREQLLVTINELERKNEIMQNELELAHDIQQGIMPARPGDGDERISVSVYYSPLEMVSGDYYDIFELPNGSLGLLITDASGHGVPAALVTMMAKVHFTNLANQGLDPSDLLMAVNQELFNSLATSDYMTAFYVVLHPDMRIEYCNAGHQKVLIVRKDTGKIEQLDTHGFFLGALDDLPSAHEIKEDRVETGDLLLLYTDGIVEGKNAAGEEYGDDRFFESIGKYRRLDVEEFNKKLIEDVDTFADGEERKDDYTLVVIEVGSPPSPASVKKQIEAAKPAAAAESAPVETKAPEAAAAVQTTIPAASGLSFEDGIRQARNLMNEKKYRQAAELLEGLQTDDEHQLDLKNSLLGDAWFADRKFERALDCFDSVFLLKPRRRMRRALCLAKLKRTGEAISVLEELVASSDDFSDAYSQLVAIHLSAGNRLRAAELLKAALEKNPSDIKLKELEKRLG